MTPRRALTVFAAACALLLALDALVYSLYRSEVATIEGALADRLDALGKTSARWLGESPAPGPLLAALVSENHLEDAYVLDAGLRVIAGVRTPAGTSLNLLRVDDRRLLDAFEGKRSVGPGYSVANARVDSAYFPISSHVLVLEAGAEFHAPARAVRTTYLVAVALTVLAALVFALGLVLALRALERARVAYGRAERLAAVGQMAAMVAHEVRNPLGILRGQTELARERVPADAPTRERERFDEMLAEIDRINRLTEDFLGLARDVPLQTAEIELRALADEVVHETRIATRDVGARVELADGEAVTVTGDRDKLRQALRNLVLNAVQVGGADVTVRVATAVAGERAKLSVVDDGPGVAPQLASTLFEPFVTARTGGSGLGLAIARSTAERHGGSLVLESPAGTRGAAFSIYLPLQRHADAHPDRR